MARTLLGLALAFFVGLSAAYAGDAPSANTGRRAKPAAKPAPKRPAVDAAKAAAAKRAAQRAAALRKLPPMARMAASAKQRAYEAKGKVFQAERDVAQAKMAVISAKLRLKQAKRMAAEAENYAGDAAKRAEAEKKQMYARQKARVEARQKAEAAKRKAEAKKRAVGVKRKAAGAGKTAGGKPALKSPAPGKPVPKKHLPKKHVPKKHVPKKHVAKKPVTKKLALRKPAAKPVQKRPVGVAGAMQRQRVAVRGTARTPTNYAVPGYWSLRTESVQNELKLSEEQKEKLKQISKSYYDEMRQGSQQDWAKYREMPAEERRRKYAEIAEKRKQRLDAARKQIEAVLTPGQLDAVKSIEFRTRAATLLRNPKILEKLGLSEEQKEKLRKNWEDLSDQMQRLLRESAQKALQILTPKQLEDLKQQ